ncbi:MAG: IS200/IS605 family element transposase accessory protein TnpB, partial [Deinococcus sp.]|nr:IS200/IS605 family element transposase accessory protein TnpB [Deinococcus sp.]
LKVPAKAHAKFKPTSIDYDARIFSFREWDWTISLTLLHARARIETKPGEHQKRHLKGTNPTAATLVKQRDGRYFLHIPLTEATPEPSDPEGTLGVDLGRRRVAVDSDGEAYEADEINRVRGHYPKVRRSVQRKGTRAAHRLLNRLSGRERRHAAHINHVISRRLVDKATATHRALVLEDLEGIRQRTRVRQADRYRHSSWSFFQLRQFIAYKAALVGVPVVFVDPAYTSQRCHVCGEIGHRDALVFSCTKCGVFDADHNAALNIAALGAHVAVPELRVGSLH